MKQLLEAFRKAVEEKNWDAVSDLDEKIRARITAELEDCETEERKQSLIVILQSLQKIYALAKRDALGDATAISAELAKLKQDRKADKAYRQGSGY